MKNFGLGLSGFKEILKWYYTDGKAYRIPFGPLRGLKMVYDKQTVFRYMLGLQDLSTLHVLKQILGVAFEEKERVTGVDLGANRGVYTLWMASLRRFNRIYSFEPNAQLTEQLRRNLRENVFSHVSVHPLALADKKGVMEFYLSHCDFTASLIRDKSVEKPASIGVSTISLDEFFKNAVGHEKIGFIKMDIEGGGVLAVKGAMTCLKRNRPILYLESHGVEEDRTFGNLLKELNYSAFRLKPTFQWVSRTDEVHPHPAGAWGNMMCIPSEKLPMVLPVLHSLR